MLGVTIMLVLVYLFIGVLFASRFKVFMGARTLQDELLRGFTALVWPLLALAKIAARFEYLWTWN